MSEPTHEALARKKQREEEMKKSIQQCLDLLSSAGSKKTSRKATPKKATKKEKKPPNPLELLEQKLQSRLDLSTLGDSNLPPDARAEMLILAAGEVGFDIHRAVTQMIARLDHTQELTEQIGALTARLQELQEEASAHPLQTEIFLRWVERPGGKAALVLTGQGHRICPVNGEIADLVCGDHVLIDLKTGHVVDRDGAIPPTGEIVRVEEVDEAGSLATVKKRDESYTAHVAHHVLHGGGLKAGAHAVWDPHRHFIHRLVEPKADGHDLLTPPPSLARFSLADLGNPHPVIFEILDQVKQAVSHPEWSRRLRVTRRRSFLFWGPTGTGKSSSIKVIVNLVGDWVEELTGTREPRVVFADASDFYSPYFGEGEEKIARWFDKIYNLAREERATRDGQRIRLPLIVVIEEIEGLIRRRGETGGSAHLFERMLGLLLQKMDSAERDTDTPIIFITTSNRKELADAAAKRRFGDREIHFPYLDARGALAVLAKKIPEGLPLAPSHGTAPELLRNAALRRILFHLFGDGEDQPLAEIVFRDSRRQLLHRRDVVSGALLESAVVSAKDRALRRSVETGELLGLDPTDVIEALDERYAELVRGLTPHNLEDHAPHLLADLSAPHIVSVTPVSAPNGNPR